jgi:hypothetical protein
VSNDPPPPGAIGPTASPLTLSDLRPVRDAMLKHATLVVGAGSLFVVAIRLLAFTSFNPGLAIAVIGAGDPAKIVLATLVGTLPIAFPFVTFLAVLGARQDRNELVRVGLLAVAMFAGMLAILTVPPVTIVLGIFTAAVGIYEHNVPTVGELARQRLWTNRTWWVRRTTIAFALAMTLLTLLLSLPPFIPTEVITFSDKTQLIGHMIDSGAPDATIMVRFPSRLVRVRTERIVDRALCSDSGDPFLIATPLAPGWLGQPLARCPVFP